ncbi:hypothetical protein SDJN03_01523, partial [Cucurbita argyrosperma subsp. sororia]
MAAISLSCFRAFDDLMQLAIPPVIMENIQRPRYILQTWTAKIQIHFLPAFVSVHSQSLKEFPPLRSHPAGKVPSTALQLRLMRRSFVWLARDSYADGWNRESCVFDRNSLTSYRFRVNLNCEDPESIYWRRRNSGQ